jgi:hypothetical protein
MRNILLYIGFIFILAFPFKVWSQSPFQATATGHISAEIITVLSAVESSQLNFGRFSPGPYGGEIILTPQGSISVLGSVSKGSGLHNAASFYLTGDNSTTFSVNLPSSPATITCTTEARSMVVKDWVSVPSPGPGAGTLKNGAQTVYIGATLEVGTLNDNPVGIYTGTYTVTFDFN